MKEKQYTKDEFQVDVGARILRLRLREGYNREEFAEAIGVSTKFLYEIETGKKGFSTFVLYRISKILNADCDYILGGLGTRGEFNKELLEKIEMLDIRQIERLIRLLDIVNEYGM
ncbi:MAG: helix-turn-helix transcriptional regulator [Lachnospiraceae bacterium]|nr:helix-turn-helix transcriptional regulator [Lachnospiraceae bacterium]